MTSSVVSRVHYYPRQFLRVDEFRDEQLYQLAQRRRHNVISHGWGIVEGLEIAAEDAGVVVRPGAAIDGYGRELLVVEKLPVALNTFDDLGVDRLDLWIAYDRNDDTPAPDGYGDCSADGSSRYRSTESPVLQPDRPTSNTVDARRPPGVPTAVLDAEVPPVSDDRADVWPVYLGRVTRLEGGKFSIDGTQRPYASLTGDTVDHPASPVRVEIGRQSTSDAVRTIGDVRYQYEKSDDLATKQARRFGVFVPEDLGSNPDTGGTLAPRLAVMKDGSIHLRGQTEVNGNLRVAGGAVSFVDPADFKPDNAPAEPSIYRLQTAKDDILQIDLGSGGTLNRQFVIGFSMPDGSFSECVRVELKDTNGSGNIVPVVTINGDLVINGEIKAKLKKERLISAEALAALLGSFQAGVAAGNAGA